MAPDDATAGASALGRHSAVAGWGRARTNWSRARVPGPLDGPRARRATARGASLWTNRGADAGAIGWRSAEAPTRGASRRAGALVSAEVFSSDGTTSHRAGR